MAEIRPFHATRYSENKFQIPPVAPPYDIISETERVKIAAEPFNIIHIDKPGGESDLEKYDRAVSTLNEWKQDGVLLQEPEAAYYIYEQEYSVPETESGERIKRVGFFCTMQLEDYKNGIVLPHEKTLAGPKKDRLSLLKKTKSNISPIFGLYHDDSHLAEEVMKQVMSEEPIYQTYVDRDGTKHTLWKLTDPEKAGKLNEALNGKKVIIADGHHRYETSLQYRDYLYNEVGEKNENAKYIMICLTDFGDSGLVVLPTHRKLVLNIPFDELLGKLKDFFEVEEVSKEDLQNEIQDLEPKSLTIGFYGGKDKGYFALTPKEGIDYSALMPKENSALWKELNVNYLSFVIFKEILKLDEETFQRDVTYTHSFFEAFDAVDNGEANFTFFLQCIDKFKVKEISENGELMPQKSTYFFPKLFTGFVLYEH